MAFFSFLGPVAADSDKPPFSPLTLVPENRIMLNETDMPSWKFLWDKARQSTQRGDMQDAIIQYRSLLGRKHNLEEARWELVRLYIHLQQWENAIAALELLLEANPTNVEYLNSLGKIMWAQEQYERAVDLFGKANRIEPEDHTALTGLVEGLIKLGRKEEALPVAEQLYSMSPDNMAVRRHLAFLAFDLGKLDMARDHLAALADMPDADQEILFAAAQLFDQLQSPVKAVSYWERYLARDPANQEGNRKLAEYYGKNNKYDKALDHLLLLAKNQSDERNLNGKIASLYMASGNEKSALTYYEKHLQVFPRDKDALRSVTRIYARLGNTVKTLESLEKYFAVTPGSKDPESLKMAAKLYDAEGRFHEAIPLYRQLMGFFPDDSEILTALVNDLLAIGPDEGTLHIWQHLAKITSDRIPVYQAMAGLLENLGRDDELIEILKMLLELNPTDEQTIIKLARIYGSKRDIPTALSYLDGLSKSTALGREFYLLRGEFCSQMGFVKRALADFEKALAIEPGDAATRQKSMIIAGRLGDAESFFIHLQSLEESAWRQTLSGQELDDYQAAKLQALSESGFFRSAFLTYEGHREPSLALQSRKQLAAAYRSAGLYYEAGQELRTGLADHGWDEEAVIELFEIALDTGKIEEGAAWLQALQDSTPASMQWRLQIFEARLLFLQGKHREALNICEELFSEAERHLSPDLFLEKSGVQADRIFCAAGMLLCRLQYQTEKYIEAGRTGRQLQQAGLNNLELLVLLQLVYERTLETDQAQAMSLLIEEKIADRPEEMLHLATLYQRYNNFDGLEKIAHRLDNEYPSSLKTRFLRAGILESRGSVDDSLAVLNKIAAQFPDNTRALTDRARLLFIRGRYVESLEQCQALLEIMPDRHDVLLLKARSLWALQRGQEAAQAYTSLLVPPVDEILTKQLASRGVEIEFPGDESIWQRIGISHQSAEKLSDMVMAPEYLIHVTPARQKINSQAAPFFSRYKWQEQFSDEFAARRAVQNREFHQAAYFYKILIRKYGADDSLIFDLAGIYSRLGMLADETDLYEQLSENNSSFPGLQQAQQRNSLKRRPRISLQYSQYEEKGWNSYKSLEKHRTALQTWFAPTMSQEIVLEAGRHRYQSTLDKNQLQSDRILLQYKLKPWHDLVFDIAGGVESLENNHPDNNLVRLGVKKQLGDLLQGYFRFSRDVIDQTYASLNRGITSQESKGGLAMDLSSRFSIGGDLTHREISDINQQDESSFRASFSLLPDPFLMQLIYRYDYLSSRHGAEPGPPVADGFAIADHPYWCPTEYWTNQFGFNLKHSLSENTLERGTPRYYTLEYFFGHDSEGYELHNAKGSFFAEYNSHLVFQATAELSRAKDYRLDGISVTLTYRW